MRQTRWLLPVISLMGYVALTAIIGRGVLAELSTSVASDAGDPVFTAMLLFWNATHVPLSHAWWQLPTFYPTADTLAFSENLLGLSVVSTPLYWITRDTLVTYNLSVLLTFPLCAIAMYALVHRLTGSHAGAFVAGLAFGFAPYRYSQLSHIQMLAAFWTPLTLLGLHAFLETGRRRWLAVYAAAWMLQAATNLYALILVSVLAGLWVLWFVIAPGKWRALLSVATASVAAAVPLAPILVTYANVHARHGLVRTIGEMREYGADLAAVVCAPEALTLWGWLRVQCRVEGELFPGIAMIVLGAIGLIHLMMSGEANAVPPDRTRPVVWRRAVHVVRRTCEVVALVYGLILASIVVAGPWRLDLGVLTISASTLAKPFVIFVGALIGAVLLSPGVRGAARRSSILGFYLVAAVITWVLALGPTVAFMGRRLSVPGPFAWIAPLPGINGIRVPARFWLITVVCLSVAAGIIMAELVRRRSRAFAAAAMVVVSAVMVTDGWARISVAPKPFEAPAPGQLAGGVVLESPPDHGPRDIGAEYRAALGGWQTINGYSGYAPSHYAALMDSIRFEEDAAFTIFREHRDLHVLVPHDAPRIARLVQRQPGAVMTAQNAWAAQYLLPRRGVTRPPIVRGRRVAVATVRSPCSTEPIDNLLDRDPRTRWRCEPGLQRPDLVADLGHVAQVGLVAYQLGPFYWEFPRVLTIESSVDGATWTTAWSGNVVELVIRGALADPSLLSFDLPFPPRPARYLRFVHDGRGAGDGWSMAELDVWTGGG